MTKSIYLDNISATKPSSQAVCKTLSYYEECFGSITSPHQMGQELVQDAQKYYKSLHETFGAENECQFVATSSGAEAVSQIISSVVHEVVRLQGKNHFVCRKNDEAPAILACSTLVDEACTFTLADVSENGYMTEQALIDSITPRTALISCSMACALTGVIQPLDELIAFAKSRAILVHIDATHCIGKIPVHFDDIGCDYLSFNGNQFHALDGTGGFFVKKLTPVKPLIYGKNIHVANLAGLTEAALEAKENETLYCTEVARLREKFESALESKNAKVLFKDAERLPHISCISFPGIKSEALLFALSRKNISASMGGGPLQHIQRVLEASHIAKPDSQCALTFSLSKDTTESDIDRAIILISECIERLRKTSKVYFSHE